MLSEPPRQSVTPAAAPILDGYRALDGTYDELVETAGRTRPHAQMVATLLANLTADTLGRYQVLAALVLAQRGVTFSVYSDERGTEKIMPVCLVPRVIARAEWAHLHPGLLPPATAL